MPVQAHTQVRGIDEPMRAIQGGEPSPRPDTMACRSRRKGPRTVRIQLVCRAGQAVRQRTERNAGIGCPRRYLSDASVHASSVPAQPVPLNRLSFGDSYISALQHDHHLILVQHRMDDVGSTVSDVPGVSRLLPSTVVRHSWTICLSIPRTAPLPTTPGGCGGSLRQ